MMSSPIEQIKIFVDHHKNAREIHLHFCNLPYLFLVIACTEITLTRPRGQRNTGRKGVPNLGEPLLDVQDLKTYFKTKAGYVRAVDGVSFSIQPGEKVALVGESGCGKSVTSLSIMRLIAQPPGKYAGGRIIFEGQDLLTVPERTMSSIRGGKIGMIFQDPMTCLIPPCLLASRLPKACDNT